MAAHHRLALAGGFDGPGPGDGGSGGGADLIGAGALLWWDPNNRRGCIRFEDIDVFLDWPPVKEFGCPRLSPGMIVKFVARRISPTVAMVLYILRVETPAPATHESDASIDADEIDAKIRIRALAAEFMRWRERFIVPLPPVSSAPRLPRSVNEALPAAPSTTAPARSLTTWLRFLASKCGLAHDQPPS